MAPASMLKKVGVLPLSRLALLMEETYSLRLLQSEAEVEATRGPAQESREPWTNPQDRGVAPSGRLPP